MHGRRSAISVRAAVHERHERVLKNTPVRQHTVHRTQNREICCCMSYLHRNSYTMMCKRARNVYDTAPHRTCITAPCPDKDSKQQYRVLLQAYCPVRCWLCCAVCQLVLIVSCSDRRHGCDVRGGTNKHEKDRESTVSKESKKDVHRKAVLTSIPVRQAKAPLRGRLTPPATLAQGRGQQNMKGQKEEAHGLVQLAT